MCKSKFKGWCLALALAAATACTPAPKIAGDPKGQLQAYIEKSFAIRSPADRKELLEFLTGEAKARLESWSDDQFREAFIESKRQSFKLRISEVKPVNGREVNITYELSYLDRARGREAKITNKKLCHLVDEGGHWLISDVHNIKELVEYQNEMSLP